MSEQLKLLDMTCPLLLAIALINNPRPAIHNANVVIT